MGKLKLGRMTLLMDGGTDVKLEKTREPMRVVRILRHQKKVERSDHKKKAK
jgi:hypothetical protein